MTSTHAKWLILLHPPVKVYKRKEKQPTEINASEGNTEPNPSKTPLDQVPSQAPSHNEESPLHPGQGPQAPSPSNKGKSTSVQTNAPATAKIPSDEGTSQSSDKDFSKTQSQEKYK